MSRPHGIHDQLIERYQPAPPARYGILLAGREAQQHEEEAAAVLRAAGHDPSRRLARLQPRPDRDEVSAPDLRVFLTRYGHEYCVALVSERLLDDRERDQLRRTADETGCALLTVA